MTTNLIETIQTKMGYPELEKVDPNTQEVKEVRGSVQTRNPGQAGIPAVLMGLYHFGSTEQGAEEILRGHRTTQWLDVFFGDRKQDAIKKVSEYGSSSTEDTTKDMEAIADEAIRFIREHIPNNASFSDVKTFLAQQRKNILVYLPAQLQIGSLLNDDTLDDRTNKMEGPMSNQMHFFEKLFSGSTTEKNEKKD